MKLSAIFEEFDENMLEMLDPLFESFSCQPGTIIFQQGDRPDFFYLVLDGNVAMSFKPHDGTSFTISHVSKGGFFGWSAVVGSDTYTSTATAIEEVEALRVHGSELRKFCLEHPEAGKNILERLADGVASRWKDAHEQVKSILSQGMTIKSNFV